MVDPSRARSEGAEEEVVSVPVERDYSQKPQKPIKLKPSIAHERPNAISWASSPGEILSAPPPEAVAAPPPTPPRKTSPPPAKQPTRPEAPQWTLHGVSQEVRDEVIRAAREDGMSVGEWLDDVLRQVLLESEVEAQPELEPEPELELEPEPEPEVRAEAIPQETPARLPEQDETSKGLYPMLEDIRDRLQALEQRKSFWDRLRELFGGKG
jgi:hypothetical protein